MNRREQIDEMGHEVAIALMQKHNVTQAAFTRYPLGPFGLREEMKITRKFGAEMLIVGSTGSSEPGCEDAKQVVKIFLEKMKLHIAAAEENNLVIAIENRDRQCLYHPDALRYFAEFNASPHLGVT